MKKIYIITPKENLAPGGRETCSYISARDTAKLTRAGETAGRSLK
jgi:hypothetical protein